MLVLSEKNVVKTFSSSFGTNLTIHFFKEQIFLSTINVTLEITKKYFLELGLIVTVRPKSKNVGTNAQKARREIAFSETT